MRLTRSLGRELTHGSAAMLVLRVALVGLEFLCALALARFFGSRIYGTYALAMSWVLMLAIPAALGLDRYLIREVAILHSRGEWSQARSLIGFSYRSVLVVGVVLGGLVLLLAPVLAPRNDEQSMEALRLAMLLVPILALARLRQAALQGFGYPGRAYVPEALIQPLALLMLIGVWHYTALSASNHLVPILLQLAAAASAMLAGLLIFRATAPADYLNAPTEPSQIAWLRRGLPFVWMLGMNVIMTSADTAMLGAIQGSSAAGVYRVASQMAMLVLFPATTVSIAMAANIASLHTRGATAELQERAVGAARVAFLAALGATALLLVAGKPLLLLFGDGFASGYTSLAVLCVSYLLCSAAGVSGYVLIMTKYENSVAVASMFAAGLNIVLNLLLIPRWGMAGAALATGVSTLAVSARYAYLVRQRLGLRSTIVSRAR